MAEILRREIILRCSPAHAFHTFTGQVDLWWPRAHRKSAEGTLRFTADALVDVAADGSSWTMARVRTLDPPRRLELEWFPGSPAAPTEVEILFEAEGEGTRVTITHRPTEFTAAIWPQRVAVFQRGWRAVVVALQEHIGNRGGYDG